MNISPGPWEWDFDNIGEVVILSGADATGQPTDVRMRMRYVMRVNRDGTVRFYDSEKDAMLPGTPDHPDARLMVAGPALLRILKAVLRNPDDKNEAENLIRTLEE